MTTFNKELIKSKLSNFKTKIDNLITKNNFNEIYTTYNMIYSIL